MAQQAVGDLMEGAMDKIRGMVDASTVVGAPVTTLDGTTLIPVSRLSFGFASGGSDKTAAASKPGVWGGSGAAVKVEPVGFLMAKEGGVRMLTVQAPAFTTADRLIDMAPELLEKLEEYIDKYAKKSGAAAKTGGNGNNKPC